MQKSKSHSIGKLPGFLTGALQAVLHRMRRMLPCSPQGAQRQFMFVVLVVQLQWLKVGCVRMRCTQPALLCG